MDHGIPATNSGPVAQVTLRDGTPAVIRPLVAADRSALRTLYEHLDERSAFHRFMCAAPHVTDAMLHQMVDEVDGIDHVAFVLVTPDCDPGTIGAAARMIRYPQCPDAADVAVTVDAGLRGLGVASALLRHLGPRRPMGVRRLLTEVASDNAPALAMLQRWGDVRVLSDHNGVLDLEIDLPRS